MNNEPKRIAVMGGTFDPIHYGHLVTAEATRDKFELEKVIFVPTGTPPHKEYRKVSSRENRYLMTILATITNPYFEVSDIELKREGYTYTVDTLKKIMEIHGEDTQIYFITGADAVMEILAWKNVEQVLNMCKIVSAYRPGYDINQFRNKVFEIERIYKNKVYLIEVPALAISSTDIRYRIKNNRTIKYLLPEQVENYVLKKGLYRDWKVPETI